MLTVLFWDKNGRSSL
uniref:Uncharacterized protein n=1 Tax=Anguilla anguilla TaxID=7936 RepID=A0A0E9QV25_ANGAN